MRYLWNLCYYFAFYCGVKLGLWPGPVRYTLKKLGLDQSDFHAQVLQIALKLQRKGHEAYIVGGCLRDLVSQEKIKPKDFDIVTSARPEQVKRCFTRSRIIGKRFRIVHVPAGADIVEVSTFRGQGTWLSAWRGARYQNNIYGILEQDVWRRDFTANALYYDVEKSEVIDFTGGVKDIKNKKLRMIGECAKRFQEDPVRILRAIRFHAKTKFTLDRQMRTQIKEKKQHLQKVSKDRLLLEVVKLFSQGHSQDSMVALQHFECMPVLFSGFSRLALPTEKHQAFWSAACQKMDYWYSNQQRLSSSFLFAVLLWPIVEVQKAKLKRMTIYAYKKLLFRILRFESRYVAIPKKLQEAVAELWILQHVLETKTPSFNSSRERKARLRYSIDLFMIRAAVDESLVEKALAWQSELTQIEANK